ncbi:MAG TPA: hypothetical protein PKA53_00695 [Sphingobacterium sp.]|nr:hypothetical protein [Sphingobacterium sp.]
MRQKIEKLLLNPFEDCSERSMLWTGVFAFSCGLAISYFGNIVFDGILQIHLAETDGLKTILGNISNVTILTIGLFALAKILYKKVRFIDILNNVLIARIPILFAGLMTISLGKFLPLSRFSTEDPTTFMQSMSQLDLAWIAVIAIFLLLFIFYFFYLLVVGVKHSINSKKHIHAILVIITVLVLDVVAMLLYRGWFL